VEDLGRDGKIKLKRLLEIGCDWRIGVYVIHVRLANTLKR
jgi:hypothetical protein